MGGFSLWHILIFAVIVLLLFGGNRFSAMMGDVAKGLKSFKQGMADEDDDKPTRSGPSSASCRAISQSAGADRRDARARPAEPRDSAAARRR